MQASAKRAGQRILNAKRVEECKIKFSTREAIISARGVKQKSAYKYLIKFYFNGVRLEGDFIPTLYLHF